MDTPSDRHGLLFKHWVRRFRCEDNNIDLMRALTLNYRVRYTKPHHQLGEVARRLSWVIELLAFYLINPNNPNINNPNNKYNYREYDSSDIA